MSSENHAQMMVDGHRVLPALLDDLLAAQHTIHLSMFLFFRDPIGWEVAVTLAKRAREGVKVRVMLNLQKTGLGDPFSTGEKEMMEHDPAWPHDPLDVAPLCDEMRAAGVEVVDTNADFDRIPEGLEPRLRAQAEEIRDGSGIDELHVDHRKLVVIDDRIAWCGGLNVGAQYLFHDPFDPDRDAKDEAKERRDEGKREPWWKWHDSLTRFEGPIAHDIGGHFRDRWILNGGAGFPAAATPSPASSPRGCRLKNAEVLHNQPSKQPNEVHDAYLRLIAAAEREIFIENPYLYQPELVEAICAAKHARPSLDVKLVVPSRAYNDNLYAQDAQEYLYAQWLECGVEVYEYQHHFTHLKLAVFDARWSIHGSTNLNYRSLEKDKDFELVVLVDDEAFAREVLACTRDTDLKHSRRIVHDDVYGSFAAFRKRVRDPRTLLLLSKRML